MSYGIAAGWDEDFLADGQGFVPAERVSDARDGRRPRELRPGALTKATELLWRVNDAQRAARVQAALESPEEEDEEMLPATGDRRENDKAPVLAAETVAVASSEALVRELGPSRASARAGLLAVPVASVDGHFQVRLLRTGQTQRSRCQEHVVDPEAVGLLQAQVDSGLSSPTPSAPRERAKLSPAQLSPVGAEATVLLQKYSQVAVNCFGEVGVEAFQLAEALFGVQDELQKMRRLSRHVVDPEAVGLLQAQVDSGLSSPTPSAPRERAKLSPAQLSPVGAEATVLLQKYSQVAVNCFGEVGVEAFQLAEALFGVQDELQKMRRLSRWLSCVNQKTVRKYLEARGPRDREAQGLDAVFHHLTANNVPAAVKELHRLPRGPHFDRLAPLLAAAGGCPLPSPQRRSLRQQLVEWKRQRVGELMNPELWRIYCLLAGDLEVIREALDWRTAFGVVFWYGQSEEPVRGSTGVLSQVVTSFVEAVKQQGISSRIRPVPSYGCLPLRETKDDLLFTELIKPAAIGKRNDPESLQFTAIRMAAGLAAGSCDVAHFDYKTYTKDPLEISLSWHFSVLMLALQGEEARAASNGVAFQRLTQQYCKLLEQNALHQWAVYVAHFLSEDRSRSALVRQLLTGYAKSISVVDEVMPWPSLPPGWLWQAKALACEQARNWCGALCCWLRCGNEEARAVSIACGYLMGPTLLGHASAPFKRGSVEAILLSPMNPAARWLLASLEELQGAMTGQDLLWAEAGREALELLRTWATSSEDARFVPQQLVRLHWKCQRLRGCMLGFPQ